ncbi:MAG: cell division protein FtsA [Deltaproteobacteria bacterium]|nr:MAG: cell division protein FtsA [Deltaproteobacteria bacterium]
MDRIDNGFEEQQVEDGVVGIKEQAVSAEREPREPGEIVVGLDVGTTKICCVVGEVRVDGVEILGLGIVPSLGIKKGIVVNIESAVASIRQAVRLAEDDVGFVLQSEPVFVGIAGNHIKGFTSPGIIPINNRKIKQSDIQDVIAAAKCVKISENQKVIHVLPQGYMVDDNVGIQNPVGMSGVRLVTNVHIVTADIAAVNNLVTCCKNAGLRVAHLVLESIASSSATLSEDEREQGVALIDIGGGTTDLAVFCDGNICHTSEIALGGHNLTNDLSHGLRTPLQDAERLKEDYGGAVAAAIPPNVYVEVPTVGDRNPRRVEQKVLVEMLEARIEEILEIVDKELIRSGQKNKINAGIVITGGTALLENLVDLAEQVFNLPVRIGYPIEIKGKTEGLYSPRCTTAAGLIVYAKQVSAERRPTNTSFVQKFWNWIKSVS